MIRIILLSSFFLSAALTMGARDIAWRNDFMDNQTLDKEWKFEGAKFMVPKTVFKVDTDDTAIDGKVLLVESNQASGLMMAAPQNVDLTKAPVMRWRWRVLRPVVLTTEVEPDDQAIVVYFGDGTLLCQKSVAFRWEVNTEVGTSHLIKYAGGMMTVKSHCVRNKESPVNEWYVEEINVYKAYMEAYGQPPANNFIISVGANSQYTKSSTRAQVDYIEFVSEK